MTADIQIGAIYIRNVTFNDSGTYTCSIHRTLYLPFGEKEVIIQKTVELSVVPIGELNIILIFKYSFITVTNKLRSTPPERQCWRSSDLLKSAVRYIPPINR